MLRPAPLLFLLVTIATGALWLLAERRVAPAVTLPMVAAPALEAPPVANPLLPAATGGKGTDAESQIELLQGQVAYLHDQVKALQQENSDLIDRLAKLGLKSGSPMKEGAIPSPIEVPEDFVGLGGELLALRELQEVPQPTFAVPLAKVEVVILDWLRRQHAEDFGKREGAAFAALGVIPEAVDTLPLRAGLRARQVGGWYDEETETLYVVDPADETNGLPALTDPVLGLAYGNLLRHFQKALLPSTASLSTDERVARMGLLGGDASLLRFLRDLKKFQGPDPDAIPADDPDHPLNQVPLPAYLRELELFPALHGFPFAQALHSVGGFKQLTAAYGRAPESTAEVLDPQSYLAEERLPLPCIEWAGTTVKQAKPFWDDRLGQFGTLAFVKRYNAEQASLDATRGWQSDRFLAYAADAGRRGHAVWQTRWQTPEQAGLFLKAMRSCLAQFYDQDQPVESFAAQGRQVTSRLLPDQHSVLMIDAADADFAAEAAKVFAK